MAYQKPVIAPPWGGWVDGMPPNVAQMNSFSQITNWLINKGRLQGFLNVQAFSALPNGKPIWGMRSFTDILQNLHTLFLSEDQPYYYNGAGVYNALTPDAGVGAVGRSQAQPYATEIMYNKVFYCNGGQALLYVVGDQNYFRAGDSPGTCLFLGKLDSHLLMVNTFEPALGMSGSTQFPARVRWSMNGNPFVWLINPATGLSEPTAGFVDIPDVEDQLTGWATIGPVGYAFRTQGITAVSVTGTLPPFKFENFSIGPEGIGCAYPYCLASFGNFCYFPARDDIYYFDGYSAPQAIGGNAKKAIFKSLQSTTGIPTGFVWHNIALGIDYLAYWLVVPQAGGITDLWIFHKDDQTWVREQVPLGDITVLGNVAVT